MKIRRACNEMRQWTLVLRCITVTRIPHLCERGPLFERLGCGCLPPLLPTVWSCAYNSYVNMDMELRILLDLCIATVLAGVVGLERELGSKPAGLRTHMIIGAVATLFVYLGQVAVREFLHGLPPGVHINTDPLRIFEAVLVGVSFIGAGTIIRTRDGQGVQYLTTAASLLLSAGIGMAVGCQLYVLAGGVTLLALIITRLLARVETKLLGTRPGKEKGNDTP